MSLSPTGFVRFSAAEVCRPGTLARTTEPGEKPSSPLYCRGSTWTPLWFFGICADLNASTRPVGVELLCAVYALLGNGSRAGEVAAPAGAATASAATTAALTRIRDMGANLSDGADGREAHLARRGVGRRERHVAHRAGLQAVAVARRAHGRLADRDGRLAAVADVDDGRGERLADAVAQQHRLEKVDARALQSAVAPRGAGHRLRQPGQRLARPGRGRGPGVRGEADLRGEAVAQAPQRRGDMRVGRADRAVPGLRGRRPGE